MTFGRERIKPHDKPNRLRHVYISKLELERKVNGAGWICAQKRPIDGFFGVLKHYQKAATVGVKPFQTTS